ncbi:MAG TPA: hypothetical protein VK988_20905 [Acidimicrobiales bacterium]|nr:hypothetical protein [Acidimicrobiales bacterium]
MLDSLVGIPAFMQQRPTRLLAANQIGEAFMFLSTPTRPDR